jgi:chromosome segregation ATPase
MCRKCQLKLCFHCHRNHGNCKVAAQSATLKPDDDSIMEQLLNSGRDQVKVMQQMLAVLTEEEQELRRQRRRLEEDVDQFHTEMMREIKTQADGEEERLKKESSQMRSKLDFLTRVLEQTDLPSSATSVSEIRAALLPESNWSDLQKRSAQKQPCQSFSLKISSSENITSSVRKMSQALFGEDRLSAAADVDPRLMYGDGDHRPLAASKVDFLETPLSSSRVKELAEKLEQLMRRMGESESQTRRVQGENRELLGEVKAMRDKNTILLQEFATLQAQNGKMQEEINKFQVELQRVSVLQQHSNVQGQGASAQPVGASGDQVASVKADVAAVSTENHIIKADLKASQAQIDKILRQLQSLQDKQNKANGDHGKQASQRDIDVASLKASVHEYCFSSV